MVFFVFEEGKRKGKGHAYSCFREDTSTQERDFDFVHLAVEWRWDQLMAYF